MSRQFSVLSWMSTRVFRQFKPRRSFTAPANKPYGKPTTYRQGIWQGKPLPEVLKPDEFWPQQASSYEPQIGLSGKKPNRKILVGVGTSDWAGSISALRTAFTVSTKDDDVLVFNAPKQLPDYRMGELIAEGQKTAALVRTVQNIAKEYNRTHVRIEMAPSCPQPKIEVLNKIKSEKADLVILGNGRYPPDSLGNVATHVALHAPCDVLIVKGGARLDL